jgi:hypothetical protein
MHDIIGWAVFGIIGVAQIAVWVGLFGSMLVEWLWGE